MTVELEVGHENRDGSSWGRGTQGLLKCEEKAGGKILRDVLQAPGAFHRVIGKSNQQEGEAGWKKKKKKKTL